MMSDSSNKIDTEYMVRAIQLARRGCYTTMPNPRVGCVLVKDNTIIGEGWHQRAGEGHAEINALRSVEGSVKGATAYVTLEPCSHHGKTGPCADALIKAGISRLVVAMQDPNPEVAGRGIERCRNAGMQVVVGICENESLALNPGFIARMQHGLPYVRLKMAMSLDGRTAMASGESQWITGSAARRDVQRLRAQSSAIITGVDSILHDDSRLTVRADELGLSLEDIMPQPLRVIVDSQLRTPANARLFTESGRVLIVTRVSDSSRHQALLAAGAEILVQAGVEQGPDGSDERVDLRALLQHLAVKEQSNEVLVETGARLAGAFVEQHLVDELVVYMAPTLLGSAARPLFELNIDHMKDQRRLKVTDVRAIGDDWRWTASFVSSV